MHSVSAVGRITLSLIGVAVMLRADPTGAQDLDTGKSGQQLFASNCAACHRTPRGLTKRSGISLFYFLREHYTSSQSTARELAAYLSATDSQASRGTQKPAAADGQMSRGKQRPAAAPTQQPAESRWDFSWLTGSKPATQAKPIKRSKGTPRPPTGVPSR
jgi:hypothetical protein